MGFVRKSLRVLASIGCAAGASVVYAEACTYNEALMAFQQGNVLRGQALLTMAANDGDQRAVALFSTLQDVLKQGTDYRVEDVKRIVLAQPATKPKK